MVLITRNKFVVRRVADELVIEKDDLMVRAILNFIKARLYKLREIKYITE